MISFSIPSDVYNEDSYTDGSRLPLTRYFSSWPYTKRQSAISVFSLFFEFQSLNQDAISKLPMLAEVVPRTGKGVGTVLY
jgi:hypothetical protein